jgi:hypothetical protein
MLCRRLLCSIFVFLAATSALRADRILVEPESFEQLGGWVVDQQFMDEMGSPFLLAHGLGTPVADATGKVTIAKGGTYRVLVRTRNWVPEYKGTKAPGRFQIRVGGTTLPEILGDDGGSWGWELAGAVELAAGDTEVSLQDLTGFEGRCDAILLTDEADYMPPAQGEDLASARLALLGLPATPEDAGEYDLVVVGGGLAGVCAAVGAARLGLDVALIQDRPVLGGANSSESRVWLGGNTCFTPYRAIGRLVRELDPGSPKECPGPAEKYYDDHKLAIVQAEKSLKLFLNCRANGVSMKDGAIASVDATHIRNGRRLRFRGRMFCDATGDGCIAALAKADHEMTVPGHMGRSNLWKPVDTGEPSSFPRCPWAHDLGEKPFPDSLSRLGRWFWESGFETDPITNGEAIRDNNFRAMYGAWDALKNARGKYPNHRLEWAAYISGKRESRRVLGDVVLDKEAVVNGKEFPDGCVPCTWHIDIHVPNKSYQKGFEENAFISVAKYTDFKKPYWLPYRCLYSRNVPNLFLAGRDISVTHEALGTVRVMRTTGMMGEVVGMAAALCKRNNCTPREAYEKHLDELKALWQTGVGAMPKAESLASVPDAWGKNLAPAATVRVSGSRDAKLSPVSNLTDGVANIADDGSRWLSEAKIPHWIELSWGATHSLRAIRLVSGYRGGSPTTHDPVADWHLQVRSGDQWQDVPGAKVVGNKDVDCRLELPGIETNAIRIVVTKSQSNLSRIFELEAYGK